MRHKHLIQLRHGGMFYYATSNRAKKRVEFLTYEVEGLSKALHFGIDSSVTMDVVDFIRAQVRKNPFWMGKRPNVNSFSINKIKESSVFARGVQPIFDGDGNEIIHVSTYWLRWYRISDFKYAECMKLESEKARKQALAAKKRGKNV